MLSQRNSVLKGFTTSQTEHRINQTQWQWSTVLTKTWPCYLPSGVCYEYVADKVKTIWTKVSTVCVFHSPLMLHWNILKVADVDTIYSLCNDKAWNNSSPLLLRNYHTNVPGTLTCCLRSPDAEIPCICEIFCCEIKRAPRAMSEL